MSNLARIVRPTRDEPRQEPEVLSAEVGSYVRTGALLYAYNKDYEAPDGKCFPIHQTCWGAFRLVGETMYQTQMQEVPPEYVKILAVLFENIMCDGTFSAPSVAYSEAQPTEVLQSPTRTAVNLARSTCAWKLPVWRRAVAGGVCTVSDILPLPVELTHKVLSYLPGSYILQLGQWEYPKRLVVPDILWKDQFGVRGEVGHVRHHLWLEKEMNWYMSFIAASSMIYWNEGEWPVMKNWRRVWDMCVRLWDHIEDIERAEAGKSGEV
ncbi:hypothetical protein AA313_de0202024 [Arthrobotrys entomopaga]|nr:hypothetical protein AA313_de0202024 [Arthrobotrys entomopaga]